jgi:multidrug efflux pump subunit AcrB
MMSMRETDEPRHVAAVRGLNEILLADTSGTISTILVLLPIMFIGGYVQTVLRPLTVTLSVALTASLIVSVTLIPLFAPLILKPGARDPLAWLLRPFTRFVLNPLKRLYIYLVAWGLEHSALVLVMFAALLVVAAGQMRLLGREIMPLMDTGISRITFEAAADTDDQQMDRLLTMAEAEIRDEMPADWLISYSSVVGSEPGVKSFGAQRLRKIPGLISANASVYGATPLSSIRGTVDVMLSGPDPAILSELADEVMGRLRVSGEDPVAIWVRLQIGQRNSAETHQYLEPTIDVLTWRRNIAITTLHDEVREPLDDLELPRGYQIRYEGEIKQLSEPFSRLFTSFSLGLVLLYLMLTVTFRSFLDPIAIMASLPLALIGAAWGLLLGGKFGSMPGFMGMILLMGIVVNNGILLVDFAKVAIKEGQDLNSALLEAVEKRTRPILMTALSSAVGMVPLAMEWAVGIERLSPLAVVTIGGLLAGTFLTLLAVPVMFSVLHDLREKLFRRFEA